MLREKLIDFGKMSIRGDMLLDLRKNLGNIEESQVPESLSSLLCKSVDYCATGPRDKIFALEGLRPRHLGYLFAVDYQRSLKEVLTRTTAQCLNEQRGLSNLLFIPQISCGENVNFFERSSSLLDH